MSALFAVLATRAHDAAKAARASEPEVVHERRRREPETLATLKPRRRRRATRRFARDAPAR
jgi:hypothetical protein